MGWSGGTRLFGDVIKTVKEHVSDQEARTNIYHDLIQTFEREDWDTQDELIGEDPAYNAALKELHPHWEIPGT